MSVETQDMPPQRISANPALYRFFTEFNCLESGTACVVGFDDGNPIKAIAKQCPKLRIVQFERSPFLEAQMSKVKGLGNAGFEYHIAHLTKIQHYNTIFVPVKKGKRLVQEASFSLDDVRGGHPDLPVFEDKTARMTANSNPTDPDDIYQAEKDLHQRIDDLTRMDIKNGVVEVCYIMQCLDTFKLRLDVLIIAEDLELELFEGAKNTINRKRPAIMMPNQWPMIMEVHQFLEPLGYTAYIYDPEEHSLSALESDDKAQYLFYLHYTMFKPPVGQTLTLL